LLVAQQYEDANGKSPFAEWFSELAASAAAKVTKSIARMEQGNFSSVRPVGSAVSESRIDFGPGYRIYFARDRDHIIILLGGGSKKRQQLRTSTWRSKDGRTTSDERNWEKSNGFDQRFQGNSSRQSTP
jgi:putative addiction module killer protein